MPIFPLGAPPDWMTEGRCAEIDPELFFAEFRGDKHSRVAKTICVNCEVKDTCLEYALKLPPADDFGIWGGATQAERKRVRAERRGLDVSQLTEEQIDLTLDIRSFLEDEPAKVVLLPVGHNDFDVDEEALEAELEAQIERELSAA